MRQGVDQGVGARIKGLREEREWSMAKLAVEADMSVSGVSMIENGKRNLTTTTLAKLARAFGVEVADLFPKAEAQLPLDFQENGSAAGPHDDPLYPTVADMVVGKMFEQADQDRQAFHRAVESGMAQGYFMRHESDVMDRLLRLPKAEVAEACIDLAREYVSLAHQAAMPERDLSTAEGALNPREYAELVDQIVQEAVNQGVCVDSVSYKKISSGIPRIKVTSGRKIGSTKTPRKTTRKKRAKEQ